ncbi:response regulator [Spartinivicinus poritis]|uniref:Response regulator n=1 Tax=Spartinivicinus poritis TaxID=2994640 RepID=A0ABT5U2Q5_9GAMM|nr:response regulator [Spartinivicinus sp. A2-2]MDE1460639.1 response regulator [Spartinivicinus sp. A2-2]
MQTSHNFSLLLGEDDESDKSTMQVILNRMNYQGSFHHVPVGQEVIDWTLKKNQYRNAAHNIPDLILLDIGLPGIDGKTVLKTLRQDETAKTIPIIMMSGSISQHDYYECIALGCNAYIQKTSDLNAFTKNCQLFIEGWIQLSQQKFI